MSRPPRSELDGRARHLLRALVAQYIRDGLPVGSQVLARSAGLDVSPATIRNVMADLEELGLIAAPHTSAGRVPTAQGYRVFVDSLVELKPLDERDVERLRAELAPATGTQALLASASTLLSGLTHFVGLVTVPRREEFAFRHIDFVPLDGRRLLVILVFTDNEVQNRVIEVGRAYTASELEQIANYLNAHYTGLPLAQLIAARDHGVVVPTAYSLLEGFNARMGRLFGRQPQAAAPALALAGAAAGNGTCPMVSPAPSS